MSAPALGTIVTSHTDTTAQSHAAVRRVGLFLIVSGLAFVILAIAAPQVLAVFYDLIASPGTVSIMDAGTRLGAGLFGALTLGWGATLHQLGVGRDAVRACIVGTLAWFVVDSGASVALGYAWNALSNAGFVAIVFVLLRAAKARA